MGVVKGLRVKPFFWGKSGGSLGYALTGGLDTLMLLLVLLEAQRN